MNIDEIFDELNKNCIGHYDVTLPPEVRSALSKAHSLGKKEGEEEMLKKVKPIFLWLSGQDGDFPNLAEKPHYAFRTEMRERLEALGISLKQEEL